jgi:PAS domain S-box-containing protein
MSKRASDKLRTKAEEQLAASNLKTEAMGKSDLKSLAHELAVHQVELEIQNEELRRSRTAAEEARDRYLDLFDFAPVGYFTVDGHSRIIEANLTGCTLLGVDKRTLKNKPFTRFVADNETDNFYLYRKNVLENNTKLNSILIMKKADGTLFSARLESTKVGEEQLRVTLTDVTERRKIAEALERSEKLYHSLFENMIDGYAFCQMFYENGRPRDFIYLSVNGAFEKLTGLKNVVGKYVTQVIPGIKESSPELFEIYGRVALSGESERFELYLPPLERRFLISVYCTQKEYFVVVFENITERKKAEEAIAESEKRFRSVLDDSRDIIYRFNLQTGRYEYISPSAEAVLGFPLEVLKAQDGVHISAYVHPDDLAAIRDALARLNRDGYVSTEYRQKNKNGDYRWLSNNLSLIRDDRGKPQFRDGIIRDITETKQFESFQKLTSEVLGILNNSAEIGDSIDSILSLIQKGTGIEAAGIRLSKGGGFPYFTQNGFTKDFLLTENTLGLRDNEGDICRDKDGNVSLECTCGLVLSGKTDPSNPLFTTAGSAWTNDALPILDIPADQDPRLHPRNRCIHDGFRSIALIPIRADGKIIGLLQLNDRKKNCFTIELINYLEGLTSSIGVALLRKQAEDKINILNTALAQHSTELEAVNKELESFSYSISHDLKAPLRSIRGFSDILLEDYSNKLDTQGQDYLHRIRTSSQSMSQLIDDILNLSRITGAGIQLEKVDLSRLAEEVVKELKKLQPDRRIEFVITPGLAAYGDKHLLKLVFDNLLGNAFKFTGKRTRGKIEFGVTEVNGEQAYFVKDNGAGFDNEYAGKLFNIFQRLHTQEEFPGTGIGLASVQNIIRRLGGKVWAEGEKGKGATFYFTLRQSQQLVPAIK